jgi:hypothetical protein
MGQMGTFSFAPFGLSETPLLPSPPTSVSLDLISVALVISVEIKRLDGVDLTQK